MDWDAITTDAMDALADVGFDAVLSRATKGDYDSATGLFAEIIQTESGRVLFQSAPPARGMFGDYVIGPDDKPMLLVGFTSAQIGDTLLIGGRSRTIRAVHDAVGAGRLFNVIAR